MAVAMAGWEIVTVMVEPALRGFLIKGLRETVPEALVFLKPFAETVEPAGTPLTTSEVSLVAFGVLLEKPKARVTTIWGAAAADLAPPIGVEPPAPPPTG